jgi:hypothetical protein
MNNQFIFTPWRNFSILRKIAIINMLLCLLVGLGFLIISKRIPNNLISKHILYYLLTVPMTIWFLALSFDAILTGKLWFWYLPFLEYEFKTDRIRFLVVLIVFVFFSSLFIYSWFNLDQIIK